MKKKLILLRTLSNGDVTVYPVREWLEKRKRELLKRKEENETELLTMSHTIAQFEDSIGSPEYLSMGNDGRKYSKQLGKIRDELEHIELIYKLKTIESVQTYLDTHFAYVNDMYRIVYADEMTEWEI